jgi:monoamine oxidase
VGREASAFFNFFQGVRFQHCFPINISETLLWLAIARPDARVHILVRTYSMISSSRLVSNSEMSIIIVGAGLSGLVCARHFLKEMASPEASSVKITVIEARNRLGGRLYAENGVDLGAAWSWTFNDRYLHTLANELKVGLEPQLTQGKSITQGYNGAIRTGGEESPSGSGSTRFRGSAASLISALEAELAAHPQVEFMTDSAVTSISVAASGDTCALGGEVSVTVKSTCAGAGNGDKTSLQASAVVMAMPPQLIVSAVSFEPPLSAGKQRAMQATPTWMFQAGKVACTYPRRFWFADKGLSGTAFSEKGPMVQIWDSSSEADGTAALAGFIFGEDLRYLQDEGTVRSSPVMAQLVQLFGAEAANPTSIVFKSWLHDPYTTSAAAGGGQLEFGHSAVCEPHMGRVFFAGTETAKSKFGIRADFHNILLTLTVS